MIKLNVQLNISILTLLSVTLFGFSTTTYAHTDKSKIVIKPHTIINVVALPKVQHKLLPQALYTQTMGHTFKRTFSVKNQPVNQVFYDNNQSAHKLYAKIITTKTTRESANQYWP